MTITEGILSKNQISLGPKKWLQKLELGMAFFKSKCNFLVLYYEGKKSAQNMEISPQIS